MCVCSALLSHNAFLSPYFFTPSPRLLFFILCISPSLTSFLPHLLPPFLPSIPSLSLSPSFSLSLHLFLSFPLSSPSPPLLPSSPLLGIVQGGLDTTPGGLREQCVKDMVQRNLPGLASMSSVAVFCVLCAVSSNAVCLCAVLCIVQCCVLQCCVMLFVMLCYSVLCFVL